MVWALVAASISPTTTGTNGFKASGCLGEINTYESLIIYMITWHQINTLLLRKILIRIGFSNDAKIIEIRYILISITVPKLLAYHSMPCRHLDSGSHQTVMHLSHDKSVAWQLKWYGTHCAVLNTQNSAIKFFKWNRNCRVSVIHRW